MTGISVSVRVSGPLFKQDAIDDRLQHHLRGAISEVTDEGAEHARRIAQPFKRTGRYQAAIRGRMGKRMRGRVMVGAGRRRGNLPSPKVYRAVVERGRYWRSTGTRFSGHHTISRAHRAVQPQVGPIVQKHVTKLVRELN